MLCLSEILLKNHELSSFEALIPVIKQAANEGAIHFSMDVKPPFNDTPENWEDRLEAAFYGKL